MTFTINQLNIINDGISKNLSIAQISRELNINRRRIDRAIASGVIQDTRFCHRERVPYNYIEIDAEKLKNAYIRGDSVLKMSKEFGISRGCIARNLKKLGYEIRSGSQANLIRFANSSKEYRMKITEKAHIATKGRIKTISEKLLASQTREKIANSSSEKCSFIGAGEIYIFNALIANKINATLQKAIYIYNTDIFIPPNIFIEIHKISNSAIKPQTIKKFDIKCTNRFKQKVEYLINSGGIVIEVIFDTIPNLRRNLDNLITFIDIVRSNPSTSCKHFMSASYKQCLPRKRHLIKGRYIKGVSFKNVIWEVAKIE